LSLFPGAAAAVERFPPPEFESGYEIPTPTAPEPRLRVYEYLDTAVLLAALAAAAWFVLKLRSRKAVFALMVLCLIYLGFWRKGCVCPIGAIQNVVLAAFDDGYAVSWHMAVFFFLPLVFCLLFGRVFCAAVCPLGAVQDLVVLKPVRVPPWLEGPLRLLAYLYLGLAVLFAATGSAFVICRYDPFVALFRLSGSLNILVLAGCFLIAGIFIGRPYCRFFCPYGVILRNLSRVSKRRVTITPDECVKCRLCEESCPFAAIREPAQLRPRSLYPVLKRRLLVSLAAIPILAAAGAWAGHMSAGLLAGVHPTVRLAERVWLEDTGAAEGTTDASDAFRGSGEETADLYAEAAAVHNMFGLGAAILGAFMGLAAAAKLVAAVVRPESEDYTADRASCLACARCFDYCPVGRKSLSADAE
jgi:NAD-dependent dihydropyrimidine dehydrogenase PreA subunit